MSVNQDIVNEDIPQRLGLIVYLKNAANNQFKLRRYGDIVYFSKELHYLVIYVNKQKASEIISEVSKLDFVKKVEPSEVDEINLDSQKMEEQINDMAKEAEKQIEKERDED